MSTYLTIERIMEMDDREMYDLVDLYLKGRFARFAIDPDTRSLLEQRELDPDKRDPEYEATFDHFRKLIYDMLYSETVLPRHHFTLIRMQRAVESQLDEHGSNTGWKRGAQGFLNLVKDEQGRAEIVLAQHEEQSAQHQLDLLLQAVQEHRDADDADEADDRLYEVADRLTKRLASA